jgi:hypothetical protein
MLSGGARFMDLRKSLMVYLLLAMILISLANAQQVDTSLADVDHKIIQWIRDWNVPGMAVGVVKSGQALP